MASATKPKPKARAKRPAAKKKSTQATVTLRLPRHMLELADSVLPYAANQPELAITPTVTRSDVLRLAILRGLRLLDEEYDDVVDEIMARQADERELDPENQELIPLEEVLGRHGV